MQNRYTALFSHNVRSPAIISQKVYIACSNYSSNQKPILRLVQKLYDLLGDKIPAIGSVGRENERARLGDEEGTCFIRFDRYARGRYLQFLHELVSKVRYVREINYQAASASSLIFSRLKPDQWSTISPSASRTTTTGACM